MTFFVRIQLLSNYWKGAIVSDDGNCICAFAGFSGEDDEEIAGAGIACYQSLKRTRKSLAASNALNEGAESPDEGDDRDELSDDDSEEADS